MWLRARNVESLDHFEVHGPVQRLHVQMSRGPRDADPPAPSVDLHVDPVIVPLMDNGATELAQVERAVTTTHVVHVEGGLTVTQLDVLARKPSVTPTARNIAQYGRVGSMATLEPECPRARCSRQFVLIEIERAKGIKALNKVCRCLRAEKVLVAQHVHEEVAIRRHAAHVKSLEPERECGGGHVARGAEGDDLRQKWVEGDGDTRTALDAALPAQAGFGRRLEGNKLPGSGRNPTRESSAQRRTSIECPRRRMSSWV